jgi:serine protease AprX
VVWGWGGRRAALTCIALLALALPAASLAQKSDGAYMPEGLRKAALAHPGQKFSVIVETRAGDGANGAHEAVARHSGAVKRRFGLIPGVAAEITGAQLLRLASSAELSITLDSAVRTAAYEDNEMWRQTTAVEALWNSPSSPAPEAPAIAIVDSGVDSSLEDFGSRVVTQTVICSLCAPDASGDGQGHGTMVAGLTAGSAPDHVGTAPNAPIVSIRTANEQGESRVSDVIAAADWIIANKAQYAIRVANFSLARADATDSNHDPLNHAVERLWFNDVVVVTAAGNHGSGAGGVVMKAPGSDPFVITVGALDQNGTSSAADDTVPAWSAHGHSELGFAKPDVSAPGRYLLGPVPARATLPTTLPERVLAPGYMWMSGTSFASAIVAGAAAQLLARHPDWSPDQVKGALMLTALQLPGQGWRGGVGEIDVAAAAGVAAPPNPNTNLYAFVSGFGSDRTFDGDAWSSHVTANAAWTTSTWTESSWTESSWSESSWSESSWSESSWSESSWTESSWTESSWTESSWVE